jgi:hypothetical protein
MPIVILLTFQLSDPPTFLLHKQTLLLQSAALFSPSPLALPLASLGHTSPAGSSKGVLREGESVAFEKEKSDHHSDSKMSMNSRAVIIGMDSYSLISSKCLSPLTMYSVFPVIAASMNLLSEVSASTTRIFSSGATNSALRYTRLTMVAIVCDFKCSFGLCRTSKYSETMSSLTTRMNFPALHSSLILPTCPPN